MKFMGPWEGGYSNRSSDNGGATMRGITHTTYDVYRKGRGLPTQDVSKLSDAEHDDIYYNEYWRPAGCDKLPPKLAVAQFDWAVNHSPRGATRTLQQWLGLSGGAVDGKWGPGTQKALDAKLAEQNGPQSLVDTYLDTRTAWYKNQAKADPKQQANLKGWLARVDSPKDKAGRQGIRTYLADIDKQCPGCNDAASPKTNETPQASPAPGAPAASPSPALTGDPQIDALHLEPDVAQKALELKQKAAGVMFTSGRRSIEDQARAMAGNLAKDRGWMTKTYAASDTKRQLQSWLDDHPEATSRGDIADGLASVFHSLPAAQASRFSEHMTGRAFDIQPGSAPEAVVRALDPVHFFTHEGGRTIWHVDF